MTCDMTDMQIMGKKDVMEKEDSGQCKEADNPQSAKMLFCEKYDRMYHQGHSTCASCHHSSVPAKLLAASALQGKGAGWKGLCYSQLLR